MITKICFSLLLFALPAVAQDVKPQPVTDPPLNLNVTHRRVLYGGEAISPGYVWAPGKDENRRDDWQQKPIGSCEWCGRPMTWKKAAFDKHALLWFAIPLAMRIADTEITFGLPCMNTRPPSCKEGNPILGGSRAQQYGVGLGIDVGMWLGASYLRRGDPRINEGGLKHWWLFPVEYAALPAVGIILNATNVQAHKAN